MNVSSRWSMIPSAGTRVAGNTAAGSTGESSTTAFSAGLPSVPVTLSSTVAPSTGLHANRAATRAAKEIRRAMAEKLGEIGYQPIFFR
jgi:hypothetical protein